MLLSSSSKLKFMRQKNFFGFMSILSFDFIITFYAGRFPMDFLLGCCRDEVLDFCVMMVLDYRFLGMLSTLTSYFF